MGKGKIIHGHSVNKVKSPTYLAWASMIDRCTSKTYKCFKDYGGRGISVCDRWRESFESFLADMGERPEGMTLDRFPNTDGNYEPGNCRWATQIEQQNNRRNNRRIEIDGETRTVAEWARFLAIPHPRVRTRLFSGWTERQALGFDEPPARIGKGANQYTKKR